MDHPSSTLPLRRRPAVYFSPLTPARPQLATPTSNPQLPLPAPSGKFAFPSGISQSGTYAVKGAPAEGEEADEEEGETKEPSWIGEPVFNTVAA